ncbi:hypothetical protein MTO96_034187 [Rhipicephalus appendiculatus]
MAANPNEPAIGIDLATTYSCVGIFQHVNVEIIANYKGNRYDSQLRRLHRDRATHRRPDQGTRWPLNAQNTVFGSKRLIGSAPSTNPNYKTTSSTCPFTVINDKNTPKIEVTYKSEEVFNPEDISGMMLAKMPEVAEAYFGQRITLACVTAPAYFNDSHRQAIIVATTIACVQVPKMLNEPTAAALAYGLDKVTSGKKLVLIVDLGGGTFDVSLLSIKDSQTFDVLVTAGDTHLGGEDFDRHLAIAYGTAGTKDETIKDVKLLDVAPLSLGIETAGGVMTEISCNTKVRGACPKIEVTFDIDDNVIVNVSARDESTGHAKSISITNDKGRLSDAEIQRLLKEAETYRLEDIAQRERVVSKNSLQGYVFSVQQAIKEVVSDKISKEEKEKVLAKCKRSAHRS